MPTAQLHRERGAAALPAVMILFFLLVLTVLYANRGLIFEQRTSANQYRSTQAFETAEAGLEWALANLNNHAFIDAACVVDAAGGTSFKSRYAAIDATTGMITPIAVRSACVVNGDGTFSCSCPAAGNPAPAGTGAVFAVELAAAVPPKPGVMQVIVHGCTSTGDATRDPRCIAGGGGASDGYAKVSVSLGFLPALPTPPTVPITAKGNVGWTGSAGAINTDAATNGVTVHAGGTVDDTRARIISVPGSPAAESIVDTDGALGALSDDALFQRFFGVSKAAYRSLATVITCAGNCANAIDDAMGSSDGPFWIEGDADISGGVTIGAAARPTSVVVNGNIRLSGTGSISGVLYGRSLTWDNTGGGTSLLRGAAIVEGNVSGNGAPDYFFDAALLRTLSTSVGSFAKIPGSWKDF